MSSLAMSNDWYMPFTIHIFQTIIHFACFIVTSSFHGVIKEIVMVFVLIFSKMSGLWVEIFLEFKLFVPMWRIILFRFTCLIVGFTQSYMHCTFAELNGPIFTMHLWWIAFVIRKPFRLFSILSQESRQIFCF